MRTDPPVQNQADMALLHARKEILHRKVWMCTSVLAVDMLGLCQLLQSMSHELLRHSLDCCHTIHACKRLHRICILYEAWQCLGKQAQAR